MVKQIQCYNQRQIAAGQPDPAIAKREEREKVDNEKMRGAVRDILDNMMSTIVTEVSLKLGGAMHAQQNAIKNIVDSYLGKNPVISDRVHALEDHINVATQKHIKHMEKSVTECVASQVLTQIEASAKAKLAINMTTIESRIDQVRSANGANASVSDSLRERIDILEKQTSATPNDIDTAIESFKHTCQQFAKSYCDERLEELRGGMNDHEISNIEALDKLAVEIQDMRELAGQDTGIDTKVDDARATGKEFTEKYCDEKMREVEDTISRLNAETLEKMKEEIDALKAKVDKGVRHGDKHTDDSVKKLQKEFKELQKNQKSGGCCTIM